MLLKNASFKGLLFDFKRVHDLEEVFPVNGQEGSVQPLPEYDSLKSHLRLIPMMSTIKF